MQNDVKLLGSKYNPPDFTRPMFCLFGIAFDLISLEGARDRVAFSLLNDKKLVFSTPNVNIAVAASEDPEYLRLVNACDMIIADGMPLVWLMRLLGIKGHRVAGSDLFDDVVKLDISHTKIFFFGGAPGVSERASNVITASCKNTSGAGGYCPGFGSAKDMASDDIVSLINQAKPSFVVAALGAHKGHQWIDIVQNKLDAPVISHLGAVVNFVAGTVRRSPYFLQRCGMEWVWRIYQEPALWRRYYQDAKSLATLTFRLIAPQLLKFSGTAPTGASAFVDLRDEDGFSVLKLSGDWLLADAPTLGLCANQSYALNKDIKFDLTDASFLDQSIVAIFVRLHAHQKRRGLDCIFDGAGTLAKKSIRFCGAVHLLQTIN